MGLFGNNGASGEAVSEALRKKREFCAYLDGEGTYYNDLDNDPTMISMSYGGGDFVFSHLTAYVDFDPPSNGRGDTVHVVVPSIACYPGEARVRGLELCNKISQEKRWIRAYIDNDDELMVDADMFITGGSFVEDVRGLVAMTMSVIDDIYQEAQQAQWS